VKKRVKTSDEIQMVRAARDLIRDAQRVPGLLELARDDAIAAGDLEVAIDQGQKALGVSQIVATIISQAKRRFGHLWNNQVPESSTPKGNKK
jgi:hypothetical protein